MQTCKFHHTFSAFWLRSSVVSVLISVKTDIQDIVLVIFTLLFGTGSSCRSSLLAASNTRVLGLTLPPSDAHPFWGFKTKNDKNI